MGSIEALKKSVRGASTRSDLISRLGRENAKNKAEKQYGAGNYEEYKKAVYNKDGSVSWEPGYRQKQAQPSTASASSVLTDPTVDQSNTFGDQYTSKRKKFLQGMA